MSVLFLATTLVAVLVPDQTNSPVKADDQFPANPPREIVIGKLKPMSVTDFNRTLVGHSYHVQPPPGIRPTSMVSLHADGIIQLWGNGQETGSYAYSHGRLCYSIPGRGGPYCRWVYKSREGFVYLSLDPYGATATRVTILK